MSRRVRVLSGLLLSAGLSAAACGGTSRQGAETKWLSIATGGTGGVYYPYGGGLAKLISENIEGVQATAEVTSASVDNLKLIRDGRADVAFTLADTLDDAVNGRGAFAATGRVPAASLAVLYTNYTHLATLASSGITSIGALKGKVISTGSPGSGTEVIALRVLRAAGIDPDRDLRHQALGATESADALKDGKIDAFFWSGGVPSPALQDLSHTPGLSLRLVPNEDVLPALQQTYGESLYVRAEIPASAYPRLTSNVPVVGVSNLLVVNASMPEDLAYRITRILFDKQPELVAIHPEARHLTLPTAIFGSPAPFHAGAVRYYKEKGIWNK